MKSEIHRFTTEYVVSEDRIRILVETEHNQIRIMWLTRRLMSRMVPELIKYLNKVAPTFASNMEEQASAVLQPTTGTRRSDNAQRQRQLDALSQIEPQTPVQPKTRDQVVCEELITCLQVQMGHNGLLLSLIADQTVVQKIPFSQDSLRQWIAVLHLKFRRAEWSDDVWPTWITAEGWNQGPDALRLN